MSHKSTCIWEAIYIKTVFFYNPPIKKLSCSVAAKYKPSVAKHYICFLSPILYPTARSCFLPLGMESGHLPDSSLSASTSANSNHIPQFGRLNKIPASGKAGAWCAKSNDGNQWLQISFGRQTTVTKVATQGRYDSDSRVTSYSVSYSVDGAHWVLYRLSDGHIKVWLTCSGISGNSYSVGNHRMCFILIYSYIFFLV